MRNGWRCVPVPILLCGRCRSPSIETGGHLGGILAASQLAAAWRFVVVGIKRWRSIEARSKDVGRPAQSWCTPGTSRCRSCPGVIAHHPVAASFTLSATPHGLGAVSRSNRRNRSWIRKPGITAPPCRISDAATTHSETPQYLSSWSLGPIRLAVHRITLGNII